MVLIDSGRVENPDNVAYWRPAHWCDDCEVGQSVDHCWWCGGETRRLETGIQRVFTPGGMRWRPEHEPDYQPIPGYTPGQAIPLPAAAAA